MPALDRAILRLASFEFSHSTDISVAVIINEAVELAHEYSNPRLRRFHQRSVIAGRGRRAPRVARPAGRR